MNRANDLLRFYSSSLSNKYQKLSEVLQRTFGLNGFWYTYLSSDGSFFQIGNHPSVGETYFGNNLFLENPYFCHPDNYQHNFLTITNDIKQEGFHTAQKVVQKSHGFSNFLCIPKKERGNAHVFGFSSSLPNVPLNSIFLQNSFALSRFCDYFLSCWKEHSPKMESYSFNIGEILGKKYYHNSSLPLFTCRKEVLCQFSKELGLIDKHVRIESLSLREQEYIPLLLQGKTAPQIGEILGISKRTVFDYIDNIKSKLGALNKTELIEILYKCQQLNLLECIHSNKPQKS